MMLTSSHLGPSLILPYLLVPISARAPLSELAPPIPPFSAPPLPPFSMRPKLRQVRPLVYSATSIDTLLLLCQMQLWASAASALPEDSSELPPPPTAVVSRVMACLRARLLPQALARESAERQAWLTERWRKMGKVCVCGGGGGGVWAGAPGPGAWRGGGGASAQDEVEGSGIRIRVKVRAR